ncbi:unnamed protein product [Spirodela intermedia]|uniref:Uncharacterized protein n=1 Tax=Spirodela intermedia TaxID=51605 RepID=A0A7I8JX54_SPIIN|nr:unnamed protein product [Spirodela intermedia]
MAKTLVSRLHTFWPFSLFKKDDLKVSSRLVHGLPIPEATKQFTFAIQEPSLQTVVYILAVQNLSEQSSLDAEWLIKSVQPDAVVVQIAPSALPEIQAEDKLPDYQVGTIPTSTLGVLRKCFLDKINKQEYENVAGNLILKEIFGVGFYGHLLAAKRAAKIVNSQFLLLNSPYESIYKQDPKRDTITEGQNPLLPANSLVPVQATSVVSSRRFCLTDIGQSQMVKSLTQSLTATMAEPRSSMPIYENGLGEVQNKLNYQAPWFARAIYTLLADLHDLFADLPAIGNALLYAQKLLSDVNQGEPVDTQLVSEVRNFRIAVEGLRIALNSAARTPNGRKETTNPPVEFNELPPEEKCHVLFAQGLKHQVKSFKSVVAIVDAGSLSGIRRHWNTPLPPEIMELLAGQGITRYYDDEIEDAAELAEKKRLLTAKPVVAVGAGATAFLGAASFSKAIHASTLFKIIAYKLPISLKMSLATFQRMTALGLAKILGPSKILATGVAGSSTKASALKVTASTEKIRAVAHSIVTSAERTSLLAMRTSFYEIMRKRKVQPARISPWATFGCSMVGCAGLLAYGDGIECAAESVPSAPMIASLGRGLQGLHEASRQVSQSNNNKRLQEALQSLMYSLKQLKKQQ